jgi:quinol monooxygenase YgiN
VILVLATFDMAPSDRAEFIVQRTIQVAETLAEDGCLEYALNLDAFEPGRVRLVERWRDSDALAGHVAAIQRKGGPPSGVTVTGRRIMVIDGEITSDTQS